MQFNAERVLANVRDADTEELLDRVTAFRQGMEAHALAMIENELASRGIGPKDIESYWQERRQEIILHGDGIAATCSFCRRPALAKGWAWHRFLGMVPVFPRRYFYCKEHQPFQT